MALHSLWKYLRQILDYTQVRSTLAGRSLRKSCSELIENAQETETLPPFATVDAEDGLNVVKHWESVGPM